jgi:hypothetical protein
MSITDSYSRLFYPENMPQNNKNKIRQAFAKRFCKALTQSGYSTNQLKPLEVLFSVSSQAIRKWISGQALPTSARMPEIAKSLGVRRAWLQDGEKPMRTLLSQVSEKDGSYSVERDISSEEMNLILKFRMLKLKQRDVIQETISTFLDD